MVYIERYIVLLYIYRYLYHRIDQARKKNNKYDTPNNTNIILYYMEQNILILYSYNNIRSNPRTRNNDNNDHTR